MFLKYAATIVEILRTRGTFDTTPEVLVNTTLTVLAGLVQADSKVITAQRNVTESEVSDVVAVRSAEETTLRDVVEMISTALQTTRTLKAATGHADIPVGLSDELWRLTDKVSAPLELALDRIDPDELKAWLETKW